MDFKAIVNAVCDKLEAITQSTRTRKTGEKAKVKSDIFKYANEAGDLFYKHEQVTAEHRFDCDSLRDAPDALDLIVGGLVSDMIIDDQKNGRALSVDALSKKYNNTDGVTVDALDALKKSVKEVNPEAVRKQTARLSKDEQIKLANEQMVKLGLEVGPDGTLVPIKK